MKNRISIILAAALVITGIWGAYQYNRKNDWHTFYELQNQRKFYDLIGHVENAQVNLSKAMISGLSVDRAKYLNDTVQQSYLAQEKLTQLPFDHGSIRRTERFLSQLGDYCQAIASKSLEGILLDESEMNTLMELNNYANFLSQQLIEVQKQVVEGGVNFGDLRREGNKDLDRINEEMKKFNLINIEERMQEYPELIYDGPFSEHLQDIKPRLAGSPIDEKQAVDVISEAFENEGLENIRVTGKIENVPIVAYHLNAEQRGFANNQEVSAAVSQKGGKILWYLNPRAVNESKLKREEAVEKAQEFLERNNYSDMIPTYSISYEGQTVVNFAYKQEDVVIYPDLIKVKIALDNGEVLGFESEGYLMSHHKRDIPEPELTEEEARERLSSAVEVERSRLAIIPTAGKHEVLCYEFKAKFGEDHYLIYIDANEGQQRRILLMIEQKDGTLVI
jgi:spore germination protein